MCPDRKLAGWGVARFPAGYSAPGVAPKMKIDYEAILSLAIKRNTCGVRGWMVGGKFKIREGQTTQGQTERQNDNRGLRHVGASIHPEKPTYSPNPPYTRIV